MLAHVISVGEPMADGCRSEGVDRLFSARAVGAVALSDQRAPHVGE